jgi:hypothetical protein
MEPIKRSKLSIRIKLFGHIVFTTLALAAVIAVTGCTKEDTSEYFRIYSSTDTPSFIKKGSLWADGEMESTPVKFNGNILVVTTGRSHGEQISVVNYQTKAVVATVPGELTLPSAIVGDDQKLYIFGKKNDGIYSTSTSDLSTWSAPQLVYQAPSGRKVYNSSVTKNSDKNEYVIAVEFCDTGTVCFNVAFLKSPDLLKWSKVGGETRLKYYTACPTLRYINGIYYMFILSRHGNHYSTMITRSSDLVNFEDSKTMVLSAFDGGEEITKNASDMDLIELNGETLIFYSNLEQNVPAAPGKGIRTATYGGSIESLVKRFF